MAEGRAFDAVVFDLDGVITDTARVHAVAWKALFDEFLAARAAREGVPFVPFDLEADYRAHLDGRPRVEGVERFLASRGVHLPRGAPDDAPDAPTASGLGNRKDAHFTRALARDGVASFPSTVRLVRELRHLGVRVGVASSSRNCARILEAAKLDGLFEARVDGETSAARGYRGKPAPDIFLACAAELGVPPARAIVVEDALVGVAAGRAGGFALVVGLDRHAAGRAFLDAGADVALPDLADVSVDTLDAWCAGREAARGE